MNRDTHAATHCRCLRGLCNRLDWTLKSIPLTTDKSIPQLTTDDFLNSLFIIYILKLNISLVWLHLTKSLCHIIMIITRVPNFHYVFYFTSVKLMTRQESILFSFGLPVLTNVIWRQVLNLKPLPPVHAFDLSNLTYISNQIF